MNEDQLNKDFKRVKKELDEFDEVLESGEGFTLEDEGQDFFKESDFEEKHEKNS